jgi:Superinfection immunity protein
MDNDTTWIVIGVIVIAILVFMIYSLPTIIAFRRNHAYKWVIFAINLAFGASGLGWLVALVWAIYPQNKSLADPVLGNPTGLGNRNSGNTLGEVRASATQSEGQRNRPSDSASALEAISKLAALAEKGIISQADFHKKKEELLSHV